MNILSDAQRELMRKRLADAGIAADEAALGTTTPEATPLPTDGTLATAERRMWKIYELEPGSDAHNFAVLLEFGPTYSIDTVVASMQRLVDTSSVLGSVIEVGDDGAPRRKATTWEGRWVVPGEIWEWGTTDATSSQTQRPQTHDAVLAAAAELAKQPFDLRREAPGRARIYKHDNGLSMILVLHHLAGDETILPPVIGILVSDDPEAGLPPAPAGDPSARPESLVGAAVDHARATWAAEGIRYPISGALPQTSPEDSWFSVLGEGPGRLISQPIDSDDVAALERFARESGATSNAMLIVVCALTVFALTDASDFNLLVPADNRRPEETIDRVGYSGNVVPMRFTFDPTTRADEAVRAAVSTVYSAMEYSSVDYGTILTALRNSGGRFPVAEVMALAKNAPLRGVPTPDGAEVSCETIFKDIVHYPLSLAFETGENDDVHLEIEYRTDVLGEDVARRAAQVASALVADLPKKSHLSLRDLLTQSANVSVVQAAARQ
ncbi:condensation domain-containing protein [Gordonia sp. ABSL49_1]|uniref:condensation domain-containing protein n=1 Tax=Gordonia sp. ABSL49_1 TaxID=2920941 RepID=UPI001F0EF8FD|nr:condensation domain-containing protein [Gordonia sp. ABSL49_1]MCH5641621.1 condensation domain-containing protein [Gordonia sp. ABSL49_1]